MDLAAYEKQGRLHLSTFFAMTYGVGFAALTATIVHVALFHGRYVLFVSTLNSTNIFNVLY